MAIGREVIEGTMGINRKDYIDGERSALRP